MGENKSNSAIWTAVITGVFALCGTIVTFLVAPVYLERMRASQTQTAVAATVAANSQPFSPPTAQVQPSATPFAPPTLDPNIIIPTFSPIPPGAPRATETPLPAATILLQESFDSNINDWPVGNSDDSAYGVSQREIVNGIYRFEVTSKKDYITFHSTVPNSDNRDFIFTFDANVIDITGDLSNGIPAVQVLFRMNNEDWCGIHLADDRYMVRLNQNGTTRTLINWTESQAINLNRNIRNAFTISTKGSNTTLSANGQKIITFNNESPDYVSPIKIGVAFPKANQTIVVEFDNIVVQTNP